MPDPPENIVPITPDARSAAEKFGAEHDRELLTILFTDLVDSTKLQSEAGNVEAARLVELHRTLVREELGKYDSREIEWAGDSCLAVFNKPSDAVMFALRMQAEHRRVRESEAKLPTVRVGMHLGEIVVKTGESKTDLFGLQVSEAARVMSVAQGNQIFCTRAVFDNARGALKGSAIEGVGEVTWVTYGRYMLKGSEEPVEVCEVGSSDVAILRAPEPSDKVFPVLPDGATTVHALVPSDTRTIQTKRAPLWTFAAAAAALIALGVFGGQLLTESDGQDSTAATSTPDPKPVKRFVVPLDPANPPQRFWNTNPLTFSPDGSMLIYVAGREPNTYIVSRRMDQVDWQKIDGTEGATSPFFSPDGEWIGYFDLAHELVKKIAINGGTSVSLCSTVAFFGSWGDDGYIVMQSGNGILRVAEAGGTPERMTTTAEGEILHSAPQTLPDGKTILYSNLTEFAIRGASVAAYDIETGETRILKKEATNPFYTTTGHLLYSVEGALMAAPFDANAVEFTAPAVPVGENKMAKIPMFEVPVAYAVSSSGDLVHAIDNTTGPEYTGGKEVRSLAWVDRNGTVTEIDAQAVSFGRFAGIMRISPDGRYLAAGVNNDDQFGARIWIYNLIEGSRTRLTFDSPINFRPVWSPDGERVAFSSVRGGPPNIYVKRVDGTGESELLNASRSQQVALDWTPDGESLLYMQNTTLQNTELLLYTPDSGKAARRLRVPDGLEIDTPRISPDGRWMAYVAKSTGPSEIYVQRFPEMEGKWLISADGGTYPTWSSDGKQLFYRNGNAFMAVPIKTEPGFAPGIPELLFEGEFGEYDVDPNSPPGQERFITLKAAESEDREPQSRGPEIAVVLNWLEELTRRVPIPEAN